MSLSSLCLVKIECEFFMSSDSPFQARVAEGGKEL